MLMAGLLQHAEKAGIPLVAIPDDWAQRVIEATASLDTERVELAALESAFRKACRGDFEAAGRMLRTYVMAEAHRRAASNLAVEAAVTRAGKRVGARRAAKTNQEKAARWQAACLQAAAEMRRSGRAERDLAGILAVRFQKTPTTIRNLLKKAKAT